VLTKISQFKFRTQLAALDGSNTEPSLLGYYCNSPDQHVHLLGFRPGEGRQSIA
jgi:hypothetical protein